MGFRMIGWILGGIALFLLFLALLVWVYRTTFCHSAKEKRNADPYEVPRGRQYQAVGEKMRSLVRELAELPFERVEITAFDGTLLVGRYYHVRDGAPVQIQFHGYRGMALRDFCGGNKLAREMGQNTLLVDQRANGQSGGHTITFGVKERRDCLYWIRYVSERFGADTPIFLSGVSMGAATVLMATELPLPQNVLGVIADCPYSSPEEIIRKVCKEDRHLPPAPSFLLVRLSARLFGRFNVREASAVEAVRRTALPILLIHGEADRFVPCDMSREIARACASPCTLVTVPDAGHGLSYLTDTEAYKTAVETFVRQCEERHAAN